MVLEWVVGEGWFDCRVIVWLHSVRSFVTRVFQALRTCEWSVAERGMVWLDLGTVWLHFGLNLGADDSRYYVHLSEWE